MAIRPALSSFLPVVLVLALSTPAHGDFKESYRLGKGAIERSDWEAAARHMQAAIDERPAESGRLAALGFQRYLPHYYLGIAQAALGDCRAAVAALSESESQGKIAKVEAELSTLRSRKAACLDLISHTESAARQARLAVSEVEEAAGQVVRLHRNPQIAQVWEDGEPSFAQRQSSATSLLVEGRGSVEEAFRTLDPDQLEAGHGKVTEALSAFNSLVADLEARRNELGSLFASGLEGITELQTRAQRALREMPDLDPVPPRLRDSRRRLESAMARAETVTDSTAVPEMEEIRQELSRRLANFRGAIASPPPDLVDAATAYFNGDFEGVLAQLPGEDARDSRVRSQACLLRAASWFGLYWVDGAQDADLLSAACREAERCHGFQETAQPHPDFFPPRFVAFFEENQPAQIEDPEQGP